MRAGPGVAAPRAKALGCSVLPLRGKIGSLFSQHPRAAAGGGFEQVFRIPGSLHPDGPEKLGICLWAKCLYNAAVVGSHGVGRDRVCHWVGEAHAN
jgi:hypothetical protein